MSSFRLSGGADQDYEEIVQTQSKHMRKQQDVIEQLQREITEITRQRIQLSRDYQEKIERMVTEIRSSEREQETHEISFLKSRIEELNEELEMSRAEIRTEGPTNFGINESEVPHEYGRVVLALEEDAARLRQQLKLCNEKCKNKDEEVSNLTNKVDQLESSVAFEKQERQSLQIVLENAQRKLESLRKENSELRRQFELQTEDLQTLLQQTEILQKRKNELGGLATTAEDRIRKVDEKRQENSRLAEAAVMEKEAALLKVKHLEREVTRLQAALERLSEEACEKTKVQLTKAKDERNNTIKKLTIELADSEKKYAEISAEYEELQRLLERTQEAAGSAERAVADCRSQYQAEAAELRARIAELEVRSADCSSREIAAREREERARKLHEELSHELGTRVWQLTEQLAQARADCERSAAHMRALKRAQDELSTVCAAETQLLKNKIDSLSSSLKTKKKEMEEVRESFSKRENQLKMKHEEMVSKLHKSLTEEQNAFAKLLEERQKEKAAETDEATALVQALQSRLTAATARANSMATQLAAQTARAEHAQHKLAQCLLKLQECEEQLGQAD